MDATEAYVLGRGKRVYFEPGTAEGLQSRGQYNRDWTPMAGLLAHELAHTRQPERKQGEYLIEGGAEEFARRRTPQTLRKLGVKGRRYRSKTREYARYARRVRSKGRRWALQGQFK
jgi:hypothetical protein